MPEPLTPWSQPLNRSLPPELRAGDAQTWTISTGLPVTSTLFLVLTGVVENVPRRIIPVTTPGIVLDVNSVATITIAGTVTGKWLPGRYEWVAFSFDGDGNRDQVASGSVLILPDPAGATPIDPRSYNERMLAQIRAVLREAALDDVAMYKIGTRELTKVPRETLMKMAAVYESAVRRERIRKGQYVPTKTIGVCFGGRY